MAPAGKNNETRIELHLSPDRELEREWKLCINYTSIIVLVIMTQISAGCRRSVQNVRRPARSEFFEDEWSKEGRTRSTNLRHRCASNESVERRKTPSEDMHRKRTFILLERRSSLAAGRKCKIQRGTWIRKGAARSLIWLMPRERLIA